MRNADVINRAEQSGKAYYFSFTFRWAFLHNGVTVKITGTKNRALLTFLLLDYRKSYRRDMIAGLLWPDKPLTKARASLRQSLSELKRALPDGGSLIAASTDEISIGSHDFASDMDQLPRLLSQIASDPSVPGFETQNMLEAFLGIGSEFDAWIIGQRVGVQTKVRSHLATVFASTSQPFERRLRYAALALDLDEFDEEAVRAQMQCQAGLHNPSAAIRIYDGFYKRLELAMDAEPALETQDLAVQIKLQAAPTPEARTAMAPKADAQPAAPALADPFVSTTIAILPFESLGLEAVPDFALLGILDQITCHLSSFKAPAVISSNSTRRYLGRSPSPPEVGAELGATYVVSGSVQTAGPQSRVTVQLADARSARVVWASTQIFETQTLLSFDSGLAEHIASAIVPNVDVAELQAVGGVDATELEPYHLMLRAKNLVFEFTRTSVREASTLTERAVTLNPQFAPAHTLRAECYAIDMWQGWSEDLNADKLAMDSHLRKAIKAAPDYGRALALWGHNRHMFDRETSGPLQMFERAVALSPNDSETLVWTVPCTCMNGFADTAIARGKRAIELSPLDPFQFRNEHFLSLAYYMKGDYDSAAEYGLSSYQRATDYSSNLRATIAALTAAGRLSETTELVARHQTIEPEFSVERFIPNHGIRDLDKRTKFGQRLIEAGLPR